MTQTFIILSFMFFAWMMMLGASRADADAATASSPTASINGFACDLYGQLARGSEGKNLFFSPFSMTSALGMTAEGARGQTAIEMAKVLHASEAVPARTALTDLSPLHETLGGLSERLDEKPVPPEMRTQIESLRAQLDVANRQLAKVRTYDDSTDALRQKAERLAAELNELQSKVDQYEFRAANALWGERTFAFQQAYLDTLARAYKTGGLFPVDFRADPDGSRQRINDWVSDQTRQRIKDLIKPGQVRSDTRLVLTNAVYFKGDWAEPFKAEVTRDEDFTTSDGTKVRVPLMHQPWADAAKYAAFNGDGSVFPTPEKVMVGEADQSNRYPADDGFLVAELPYKGGDLSMVILLPRSADGLSKLESKLSAANLNAWTAALRQRRVKLALPKFKLETDYDMIAPLEAMGMRRAFVNPIDPNGAEFDGISPSPDPAQRLYIGAVIHKAFVDVNEKGTEAAAATAVIMAAGSAAPRMVPFVPTFRADHPFVLIVRENAGGTVLFMGRVTQPGE